MGTRADFYVGKGKGAEWIGSIAWDGYPDGIDKWVFEAKTEDEFRKAVSKFFSDGRDDVTLPNEGWPWPWETSHTTDYSYAFFDGKVWATAWGYKWFDPLKPEPEGNEDDVKTVEFPDMGNGMSAKPGTKKSGIMVIGVKI